MRLTLDIDRCGERRARGVWNLLRFLFPNHRIQERVSASGKGRHFIVYGAGKDWDEICQMRRWLGDDPKRLKIDQILRKACHLQTQVLFTVKGGRHVKVVREIGGK